MTCFKTKTKKSDHSSEKMNCYKVLVIITVFLQLITDPAECMSNCTGDPLMKECPTNCSCCLFSPKGGATELDIDCGHNQSKNFEKGVSDVIKAHKQITQMKLEHSPMSNLSEIGISNAPHLAYVYLDFNLLKELFSDQFQKLQKLLVLTIQENNLENLHEHSFNGLEILDTLRLNNNSIHILPREIFQPLKQLINIELANNSIEYISDGTFDGLEHLQFINLNHNRISSVGPRVFINLPSIVYIHMTGNILRELDVWPVYVSVNVKHLTYIYLDSNQIATFTNKLKWFYNCSMEYANGKFIVENNQVRHFMDAFNAYGLDEIRALCLWRYDKFRVSFLTNPLVCDCIDYNVYRYIFRTTKAYQVDQLRCYFPTTPDWYDTKLVSHHLSEFFCDVPGDCPSGCHCLQRPNNMTLHINCHDRKLNQTPNTIPHYHNMTGYSILLQMSNNQIQTLNDQWYYGEAFAADFSKNHITNVTIEAIIRFSQAVKPIKYLLFHDNQLQSLPEQIKNINLSNIDEISLHSNPWSCTCEHKWLSPWLKKIKNKLYSNAVLCSQPSWLEGQNILTLDEENFCSGNPKNKQIIDITVYSLTAVVVTLMLFGLPFLFIYKRRVWIYTKFHWHPFDWDECEGENKEFDAFISYANEDENWVLRLIENLRRIHGFRIMYHRIFDGSKPIVVNVGEAVDNSKRTICVVSEAFVQSQMCIYEFQTALDTLLQDGKSRLIVIKYEDVHNDDLPRTISQYMNRYTYVDRHLPTFMEQLLYSLPVNRSGQRAQIEPDEERQHLLQI